uniref:Thymidine kinase n=1 Tax=Globisporangium ultimum (strain ATCC 200006 / CBS 805.95 / DAOM BR144) TaxID=431595 RepID=K3WL02_GLOUD
MSPPHVLSSSSFATMRTVPGHLQLIIGPMFSGKSTELIRRMRRFHHAKLQCLVIKYKNDTRYSDEKLSTHDKLLFEAKPVERLAEARAHVANADVIGIDEGQFFPDLVEFCLEAADAGKVVIVAALDGTFERKPFGSVCELIPAAEQVIKLNAVCTKCGHDAAFTRRIVADTSVE